MSGNARTRSRLNGDSRGSCQGTAAWGTLSFPDTQVEYDKESISDVVTKNYSARIKRGEIINNPCTYVRDYLVENNGNVSGTQQAPGESWFQYSGPVTGLFIESQGGIDEVWQGFDYPETDVDALLSRARLEALSNIDSTPYAFGEDIGELKETARFLKKPMKSWYDLAGTFRKSVHRRFRKGSYSRLADASADAWLEYRFAFMPLVRSTFDALSAFNEKPKELPKRLTSRGIAPMNHKQKFETLNGNGGFTATYDCEYRRETLAKAQILYEVDNPIRDWRFTTGLRWKDLPTTIWQLMPYSFMVDRVTDISSFSRAAINLADPSVRILAASTTLRDEVHKWTKATSKVNDGWSQTVNGSTNYRKDFLYNRVPYQPSLYDLNPGFNPGRLVADFTSIADLSSLILKRLRF